MEMRTVVYVYPDIAFAVSFLMNYLILLGTARINKLTAGWPRITAGAFAGAVYSFAAAFPQCSFLHGFWLKILFSVVLFAIAFMPLRLKRFAVSLTVFYIVSFSLGGFFVGILYFIKSTPYYVYAADFAGMAATYFVPALAVTVVLYLLAARFAARFLQDRIAKNIFRVPVKVSFGETDIETEALIDTGNQLKDPLSRVPVVVVEYGVLKKIFPGEIRLAFEYGSSPDLMMVLDALAETPWSARFRIIPFTSLGRENGLLIGFRPDHIQVNNGNGSICTRNVIVGIYNQELSPEGEYHALLHPDVLGELTA